MRFRFFVYLGLLAFLSNGELAHARKRRNRPLGMLASKMEAALVKPPVDQEICFSPEEPCDIKLTKFVASAEKTIDLAIYDLNLDEVVHQLLVQSKKIKVRVLADRKQAKGSHSAIPLLIKAGVSLRFGHQRGIMHNKFVIVDGKMVETGSFNHTFHAASANNENQIYLAAPEIVRRYRDRFEKIWSEGDEPRRVN